MILFKSCPKCSNGDLVKTSDIFGTYVECLQCGYSKDITQKKAAFVSVPVDQPAAVAVRRSA